MKVLMLLLAMPSALALAGCSTPVVSERPCPRLTEFPLEVQQAAAAELAAPPAKPALDRMMASMAADRAFNRSVCKR
ncbi:hypothetical protein EOD42_14220 [Rhodovarius crocodyli]|uniref:Lipoprotein n=1 Tax=Rhodovarius crocodyli TaxID=1979269 RepID=A0A437MF26_9PROT|nr:hypothetical protein [Rhodovarius crocodyli]RVT96264.1 hypothetical protein EOD42_14220 [Rhodovarius crocodyli]